ncbi:NADH-quinone oxidoreductase subunit NuoE [Chloroflexota bacterium]
MTVEAIKKDKLEEILGRHRGQREELIPVLQEIQTQFGYLPSEAMLRIAQFLRLSESTVYGVATFYAQFKFVPVGRRMVRVCRGTACHVRGGTQVLGEIERRLGIKQGETTEDKEYTLETVACIGACALAPTMTIDNETYGQMTTKKASELFGGKSKDE